MIAIAWVYGLSNLCRDIEFMLNRKVGFYWKFCWAFVVPVGLSVILTYSLATAKPLTHDGHSFPTIAIICGWILAAMALLLIPICAIHTIMTRRSDGIWEKIKESFRPTADWGPSDPQIYAEWKQLPEPDSTTRHMKETVKKLRNRIKNRDSGLGGR